MYVRVVRRVVKLPFPDDYNTQYNKRVSHRMMGNPQTACSVRYCTEPFTLSACPLRKASSPSLVRFVGGCTVT